MSFLGSKMKFNPEKLVGYAKTHENEIWIASICVLVVYLLMKAVKKWRSNYPPGPMGLPFVGYMPFLTRNLHDDFTKLAKRYGDVFSLRMGNVDVVVLNGVEAIRDAFAKPEFLGRPEHSSFELMLPNSPFFIQNQQVWREHRRFVVQSMKDLGLGKTRIERDIQEEIHFFLEALRSSKGQLTDPKIPLSPSMSNNICALVFGKRYEYNDPVREELDKSLNEAVDNVGQTSTPTFFPWTIRVPFISKLLRFGPGVLGFKKILDLCKAEVERHRQTFDSRNIRDFIDSYLVEMKKRQIKDPNTTLSDDILLSCVVDLFAAGSETVRTSLHWFLYVIAAHPKVRKQIQREIDDVIGTERLPEYVDQKSMPYTQAVIYEIMRWKTIVPLNVLRITVADATVKGYDVPKGVLVMANLWAVHHDPKLWKDPDEFQPERFLSKDKRTVVKSSNFMPFSIGKRACPGEPMALMELFLYFTSVLQKFDILLPEGAQPSYDFQFVAVYSRKDYKVRFIPRDH